MTRDKALKLLRLKMLLPIHALWFVIIFAGCFLSGIGFSIAASPFEKTENVISASTHENIAMLQFALIKNLEKLAFITPANEIGDYYSLADGIFDIGFSHALDELLIRAQIHAGKAKPDIIRKFNDERLREIEKYMKDQSLEEADISLIILNLQGLLNDPSNIFKDNSSPYQADIDDIIATTNNPNDWLIQADEDAKDPDYYIFPELTDEELKKLGIKK